MSQKTFIIIIISSLLAIGIFVGGFILLGQGEADNDVIDEESRGFFPFGESASERVLDVQQEQSGRVPRQGGDIGGIQKDAGVLRQLSQKAIAGAVLFERDEKNIVRYIERPTGHMYEIIIGGGRENRISNTTIPAIRDVLWGIGGNNFILRYLDADNIIKSVAATLIAGEGGKIGSVEGVFLPDNIHDIAVSVSGESIFYLLSFGNTAVGTRAAIDGSGRKQIFESPIIEWTPQWVAKNTLTLFTKPSAHASGFLYDLNAQNGEIQKILGDIPGLTSLVSPDEKWVLYSVSRNSAFETFLYDRSRGIATLFPLITLPEKCIWSKNSLSVYCGAPQTIPQENYPDAWYQGVVSFNDTIWKVNTETGALTILAFPEEDARESIDLIHPSLDIKESVLIFTNKKDSSLWSLQLR